MFTEFGIIILVQLVGFVSVFIYLAHTLDYRLQRMEAQHATMLEKLNRRNSGDGKSDDEHPHLGEEAGKLIDEYRQRILLSSDPQETARYAQMITDLKAGI